LGLEKSTVFNFNTAHPARPDTTYLSWLLQKTCEFIEYSNSFEARK